MNNKDFDRLYTALMNGVAFGYVSTGLRFPVFHSVLHKGRSIQTQNNFLFSHFGSSATDASKESLAWLLDNIFKMNATDFLRRYYPECNFVCELPRRDKFVLFKRIKKQLTETGQFCFENLRRAMNSKLSDFDFGY